MKILLKKASKYGYKKLIEIKDLEELRDYIEKLGEGVIIYREKDKEYDLEMCIYDSYIE